MNSVPQTKTLTYVDGQLDALQRLAPLTTELDSDYFRGYRDTVIKYGVTPF
ncbi:hypothetical protein ACSQ6I_28230 [Anabaena sp. WFMT]|jgi:hypothetical protein|uniref:hypothetical protein n=1 Tax=Anabaena sp. WFMT TaxID=3449730 RepID=UPI003F27EB0F